ncbi:hypothetical protein ACFVHS_43975 [Streptomyces sp. NPDC057746]|uniref:hypothetical protein n=1 Tax=Streptomyces sp. NPDC057746 TaxID=3346237 RepID=UPI0036A566A7
MDMDVVLTNGKITLAPASRIRIVYSQHRALYGPTVIAEAATLLEALLDTGERNGYPTEAEGFGWLATAAAEAAADRYCQPTGDRTASELAVLRAALRAALGDEGLTIARSVTPMGVAVEPEPGGPSWGSDGTAGLAVTLRANKGWELEANVPYSQSCSIVAPTTEDGAREVAALVRDVTTGKRPDPFPTWR